jgi:uncharacterized protein (UPF0261 family)
MATVVLLGTLDTKGEEYAYLRERIRAEGCDVILLDAGTHEPQIEADISREEVARAAGTDVSDLAARGDRGLAVEKMGRGAAQVAQQLLREGRLDGILAVGGSGNSSIAAQAMQALPVGVPKLIVSTLASGDTRPYIGSVDIAMMYSVVDIAGINRISERILTNAAGAIAGMANVGRTAVRGPTEDAGQRGPRPSGESKTLIAATMFGVTTPCVTEARQQLEANGYEVVVFHATGTGGRSMEALIRDGFIAGVLDITTTELADELVGGVLSAGPDRLEIAGELGIPQVVSLGALDMVNFGPVETVPEKFRGRNLYRHNPTVTLMRTTAEETAELGRIMARKLSAARGPVAVFIPLRGTSMIAVEGGPFYDPGADRALIENLEEGLGPGVEVQELDMDINDPRFARAMAERLDEMVRSGQSSVVSNQLVLKGGMSVISDASPADHGLTTDH